MQSLSCFENKNLRSMFLEGLETSDFIRLDFKEYLG